MNQSNAELFDSLYSEYRKMVMTICRGYMKGDIELASDLTQDVFINVWNSISKFRNDASYKTWIYRITVNTCLLQIRSERKKVNVPIEEALEKSDVTDVSQTENEQALYQAIGKLEAVERLMIMMVLEELPQEDIAQIMGITENNLRVKIHRAKTKLKNLIENGKRNG